MSLNLVVLCCFILFACVYSLRLFVLVEICSFLEDTNMPSMECKLLTYLPNNGGFTGCFRHWQDPL